jgi:hypothetical protein
LAKPSIQGDLLSHGLTKLLGAADVSRARFRKGAGRVGATELAAFGLAAVFTIGTLGGISQLAVSPGSQGLLGAKSATTTVGQAAPVGRASTFARG